jgi:predicted nucleic acid-binding protein
MYALDSYAWLEYFHGSAEGQKVDGILRSSTDLYTPTVVFAEVKRILLRDARAGRETRKGIGERIHFMKLKTLAVDLNLELAEKAAELADELAPGRKGFGFADAAILATARSLGAKVVTGDEHFRGLPDVAFIKE